MKKNKPYDTDNSFGWLMATAAQQIRQRLNRKFAEKGLDVTSEQWSIMVHLWHEEGLTQQNLANLTNRSKVAAFKLIEGLEKKGLIIRKPDPDDGRCNKIFLTDDGKDMQESMIFAAKENLSEASRGISDEDIETFKNVLRQLIINTKK